MRVAWEEMVKHEIKFDINASKPHLRWQTPASTEGLAALNLLMRAGHEFPTTSNLTDDIYVAYPWATVIDMGAYDSARQHINSLIEVENLRSFKRVHTVCQHIYWPKIMQFIELLGVTDLHLSHATTDAARDLGRLNISVHSFPLIPVAYVDEMLNIQRPKLKPLTSRDKLVTFVGAHMPHYRSGIRTELQSVFKDLKRNDVFFSLSDQWFFNDFVYRFQVRSAPPPEDCKERLNAGKLGFRQMLENSKYSLCPEGAGPNTLRFWESLVAGAIPVIFKNDWVLPRTPRNFNWNDIVLSIDRKNITNTIALINQHWEDKSRNALELSRLISEACDYYANLEVRPQ